MIWDGWELKDYLFPTLCCGQGHISLEMVSESPIQAGLGHSVSSACLGCSPTTGTSTWQSNGRISKKGKTLLARGQTVSLRKGRGRVALSLQLEEPLLAAVRGWMADPQPGHLQEEGVFGQM